MILRGAKSKMQKRFNNFTKKLRDKLQKIDIDFLGLRKYCGQPGTTVLGAGSQGQNFYKSKKRCIKKN